MAAVHIPAGLAAGDAFIGSCLAAITKEGGIEYSRGTLRRTVLLLRPCCAWRRKEQQFIAASKLFNATFTPILS